MVAMSLPRTRTSSVSILRRLRRRAGDNGSPVAALISALPPT
jgi:hypothetical protein